MKIDCHTHTNPFSACSTLAADDLLVKAESSQLDGVVLTEHEVFWPEEQLRWLKKAHPELRIFNGVETDVGSLGHVVIIPARPDDSILKINTPDRLASYIASSGNYAFVAHPFRFDREFENRNPQFDLPGVEVASYNMHDRESVLRSVEFARERKVAPIAASDAHSPEPIGKYYLEFEVSIESQQDLIVALHKRDFQPVAPVLAQGKDFQL